MMYIDQMNRQCVLESPPKRIVSLVPSQSELIWDLGLKKELVGITKFCIHPGELYRSVERIGGTKQLNIEKIQQLKPDLIIGNKEENVKEQIEQLERDFPLWMSDVNTLEDALNMISAVAELCHRKSEGEQLVQNIKTSFQTHTQQSQDRILYLIWKDPFMAVGKNTFIDAMIKQAGFHNSILTERYPEITMREINELNPDQIFLSTEPFPFNETTRAEIEQQSGIKTRLVDGELFSWYGSRLMKSASYFTMLHH